MSFNDMNYFLLSIKLKQQQHKNHLVLENIEIQISLIAQISFLSTVYKVKRALTYLKSFLVY